MISTGGGMKNNKSSRILRLRLGHWSINAQKARLGAFGLWCLIDSPLLISAVKNIGYTNGDEKQAIVEAFQRESAVALELIIKSVIVNQFIAADADIVAVVPPANHNILKLWYEAGLPQLKKDDKHRLLNYKSILM